MAGEVSIQKCLVALFDLYCEENAVPATNRQDVKGTDLVQWMTADGFELEMRIERARVRIDMPDDAWDMTRQVLTGPTASLFVFQTWPMLVLGRRKCAPGVQQAELTLTMQFGDGVLAQNSIMIKADPQGKLAFGDGELMQAIFRCTLGFFQQIKADPLQAQHDRGLATAQQQTAEVENLAQQPVQGGF